MKPIYAESSFLVSLILQDSNTDQAVQLAAGLKGPLAFNSLLKLEVFNAIQLKIAEGKIDAPRAAQCEVKMAELLELGMWRATEPVWERVIQRSIGLSKAHTSSKKTRSFDILHVAAAVELGATEFWTFDKRQRALAAEAGLRVNP